MTLNSRLPSPALFLPVHLHANSLFTEYALPPLAMNSGRGTHLPTKQGDGRGGEKTRQGDNIGGTLGKCPPEALALAANKDLGFKS